MSIMKDENVHKIIKGSIKFKLDKDSLQRWFYPPFLMNCLKVVSSEFKETYLFLMDYPSISGDIYQIMPKIHMAHFAYIHRCKYSNINS